MPFDILFETNRFNLSEVKDHFINPICFGEDVAAWLRGKLVERGIPTIEPGQEDWGWYVESTLGDSVYFIGIGGNPDELSRDPNYGEWRIIVEKHRSLWQKLRVRNATPGDEPMIAVIREILEREGDFENVRFE
jgi:hypothetical protein